MKKLLWLDDVRNPYLEDWLVFSPIEKPFDCIWVKSYSEFINYIETNGLPNAISFDHDLGTEETGYDCAKYLVNYCLDNNLNLPIFSSHSANPVGKENILKLLNNFKSQKNKL